eukprot:3619957-Alexandrium_andersonii.AAC.1
MCIRDRDMIGGPQNHKNKPQQKRRAGSGTPKQCFGAHRRHFSERYGSPPASEEGEEGALGALPVPLPAC